MADALGGQRKGQRMARGDCQRAFALAAAADGIRLDTQSVPWICQRGHYALPSGSVAREALASIYAAFDGNAVALEAAPATRLTGDFVHAASKTVIEVDEHQHFTSARLTSFDSYPAAALLGFDPVAYAEMCGVWRLRADRAFAHKAARGFGPGGRQRQRAYYDALRDLAAPEMGYSPVIRILAPDGDGQAAYGKHRGRMLALAS